MTFRGVQPEPVGPGDRTLPDRSHGPIVNARSGRPRRRPRHPAGASLGAGAQAKPIPASRDLPGRRSRLTHPTPVMRVNCPCGRNPFDVTDMGDHTHPRWDAVYKGLSRYLITWHIPPTSRHRSKSNGLVVDTWTLTCRCEPLRTHTFRNTRVAAAWERVMGIAPPPGAIGTAILGQDL